VIGSVQLIAGEEPTFHTLKNKEMGDGRARECAQDGSGHCHEAEPVGRREMAKRDGQTECGRRTYQAQRRRLVLQEMRCAHDEDHQYLIRDGRQPGYLIGRSKGHRAQPRSEIPGNPRHASSFWRMSDKTLREMALVALRAQSTHLQLIDLAGVLI